MVTMVPPACTPETGLTPDTMAAGPAASAGVAVRTIGAATRPTPAAIDTANALSLRVLQIRGCFKDVVTGAGTWFTGSPNQRGTHPGSGVETKRLVTGPTVAFPPGAIS